MVYACGGYTRGMVIIQRKVGCCYSAVVGRAVSMIRTCLRNEMR